MPYSPDDIEKLPKNVQGMDDKSRRQWTHIWNSSFEKDGDEAKAFAEANGVLKKEGEQPKEEKGFSIELADPPNYNPEDPESVKEFIAKQVGLPIEVKGIKEPVAQEEEGIPEETFTAWLGGAHK